MSDVIVAKKSSDDEIEQELQQLRKSALEGDANACTKIMNIHLERKDYGPAAGRALMLFLLYNTPEEEKKRIHNVFYDIHRTTPANHKDRYTVEFLHSVTEGSTKNLLITFLKDKDHKIFYTLLTRVLQYDDKISEIVCNSMLKLIQLEQFKRHTGTYSCLIRASIATYLFQHGRGKEALLCKPFVCVTRYEPIFMKLQTLESSYSIENIQDLSARSLQPVVTPAAGRAPAMIASSASAAEQPALSSSSGQVIAPAGHLPSR